MFTEGMLVLDKVLMGVIEIEPKEILIDGLRKELCKKMAKMLHEEFIFKDMENATTGIDHSKQGAMGEFGVYEMKFLRLKANFVGLKRSIEYIQDFLNVQGEKIWREELSNIVDNAVEREATRLVNKKYTSNIDDDTTYRPEFDPVDTQDQTFMGRLLRHILATLDSGFYLDHLSTWYSNDGKQVFGLRYINFLHEHLGTIFL
jgi:WASH complex subunit strumpellin